MKVKFIGDETPMTLRKNKIYEVVAIENSFYRIVDETDEDYLYHKSAFEIVEE